MDQFKIFFFPFGNYNYFVWWRLSLDTSSSFFQNWFATEDTCAFFFVENRKVGSTHSTCSQPRKCSNTMYLFWSVTRSISSAQSYTSRMEDDGKRSRRTTKFRWYKRSIIICLVSSVWIQIWSGDFTQFGDNDSSDPDQDDDLRRRKSSSAVKGRKGSRNKECPGCGSSLPTSIKQCPSCDYQFTSKSMLMLTSNQTNADESQAIRDRFPFEPERVFSKIRYFVFLWILVTSSALM